MPFAALLIGGLLIVVAINNSHGQLATELETDLPKFFVWGAAIGILLGLGFIPGLAKPTRWLLALVALVIVLTQYKSIIAGFQNFAEAGASSTGSGASSTASSTGSGPDIASLFSPSHFLTIAEDLAAFGVVA